MSNDMVSGDDGAMKGTRTQLSLIIEESYII